MLGRICSVIVCWQRYSFVCVCVWLNCVVGSTMFALLCVMLSTDLVYIWNFIGNFRKREMVRPATQRLIQLLWYSIYNRTRTRTLRPDPDGKCAPCERASVNKYSKFGLCFQMGAIAVLRQISGVCGASNQIDWSWLWSRGGLYPAVRSASDSNLFSHDLRLVDVGREVSWLRCSRACSLPAGLPFSRLTPRLSVMLIKRYCTPLDVTAKRGRSETKTPN